MATGGEGETLILAADSMRVHRLGLMKYEHVHFLCCQVREHL